jgi:hypothetical protein
MTKKNGFLILTVLLLGLLSIYLNRDRFRTDSIQIGSRSLPPRGWMLRRNQKSSSNPVLFLLNRPLKLTSVKVIPVADAQTNKFPHPIWELVSDSNSIPTKEFYYGVNLRGMKPSVKGATADPLQPGVQYRLYVEASSLKAEYDFTPAPRTP